jgi:hypothetical protein
MSAPGLLLEETRPRVPKPSSSQRITADTAANEVTLGGVANRPTLIQPAIGSGIPCLAIAKEPEMGPFVYAREEATPNDTRTFFPLAWGGAKNEAPVPKHAGASSCQPR